MFPHSIFFFQLESANFLNWVLSLHFSRLIYILASGSDPMADIQKLAEMLLDEFKDLDHGFWCWKMAEAWYVGQDQSHQFGSGSRSKGSGCLNMSKLWPPQMAATACQAIAGINEGSQSGKWVLLADFNSWSCSCKSLDISGLAAELPPGTQLHANTGIDCSELKMLMAGYCTLLCIHAPWILVLQVEKFDPESMNQELPRWSSYSAGASELGSADIPCISLPPPTIKSIFQGLRFAWVKHPDFCPAWKTVHIQKLVVFKSWKICDTGLPTLADSLSISCVPHFYFANGQLGSQWITMDGVIWAELFVQVKISKGHKLVEANSGIKMTIEPPKGLKQALLRAYLGFDEEWFLGKMMKNDIYFLIILDLSLSGSIAELTGHCWMCQGSTVATSQESSIRCTLSYELRLIC